MSQPLVYLFVRTVFNVSPNRTGFIFSLLAVCFELLVFSPNACYSASSVSALFSCSVAPDSSVGDNRIEDRGMQADSDANVFFQKMERHGKYNMPEVNQGIW